jgi:hypothetical protein
MKRNLLVFGSIFSTCITTTLVPQYTYQPTPQIRYQQTSIIMIPTIITEMLERNTYV